MVTGVRRGRVGRVVVDFGEFARRRLGEQLVPELERGHLLRRVRDLHNVADWRAAVRKVGRERGWRVRTGMTSDGERVWAVREDLELTPEACAAAMWKFHSSMATARGRPRPAS